MLVGMNLASVRTKSNFGQWRNGTGTCLGLEGQGGKTDPTSWEEVTPMVWGYSRPFFFFFSTYCVNLGV